MASQNVRQSGKYGYNKEYNGEPGVVFSDSNRRFGNPLWNLALAICPKLCQSMSVPWAGSAELEFNLSRSFFKLLNSTCLNGKDTFVYFKPNHVRNASSSTVSQRNWVSQWLAFRKARRTQAVGCHSYRLQLVSPICFVALYNER